MNQRSIPRQLRRRAALATLTLGLTFGPALVLPAPVDAARAAVNVVGLSPGARGDDVKALQQALIAAGVTVRGGADGVYGNATAAAVSAFQQARGLPATGTVDAATATALGLGPSPFVGLAQGARGDVVKQLQQTLVNHGVSVAGGVDGIFGRATAAAVSAFQQAKGLAATGSVDEATASALGPPAAAPASPAPAAPAAPAANPLLGLRIGATGDAVRQLQQTLVDRGMQVRGGVDGIFGVATANALSQFQYANKLKVNARVDEATLAALGTPSAAPAPAAPAPAAPAPSPMLGLKPGSTGASVKELQQRLIDLGIAVRGGADGIFGPVTANALKTFQTSQGLAATGSVDDATAAALASPKPAAPAPVPETGGALGFASYGERGERVKALQQALVSAGVTVRGGVDGVFGSGTAGAVMTFQKNQGIATTGVVDSVTGQALGLTPLPAPGASTTPPATSVAMATFPVQGICGFVDTWHQSRGGGRVHEGTDVIAKEGQYVYAVADGRITQRYVAGTNALTGNGLKLATADGTYFFYAHLQDVAPGIDVGVPVKAGQIIGYVGRTGNTTVSHLHFEVHPQGGAAINPYPLLKAIDGCKNTAPPPQP
jgi:peptidoglycan hydrolase-like protein with peptidoglycan-binding domain